MSTDCISFRETNYFSNLICDYLDEKPQWQPFYNRFSEIENFKAQIEEKRKTFDVQSRTVLVEALKNQYKNIEISELTLQNIDLLKHENTYTVTTGHQLNLFTGPLYFLYKIVATMNLCKELKAKYPNNNFVPIYWMATEDHDFEEINYFNLHGKKIKWPRESTGAVGELDTLGLDNVFTKVAFELGVGENANTLKQLFKSAYLKHDNLTEASRYLVNELFSKYGLVIIDGNDKGLKQLFIPYIKDELINKSSYKLVAETNQQITEISNQQYKIQVTPREINLFYIIKDVRGRIIEEEGLYSVVDTNISWNEEAILKELNEYPEHFSPNVIMRPLYQEVILPNLCYIGGGGELAYWLQLKSNFEAQKVAFPILLLRNSVLLITQKQQDKLEKLNLNIADLFLKQTDLIAKVTKAISEITIDFTSQKNLLKKQFENLHELAKQTDKSFLGAVNAQERKQIKGLENLEKRLLKAQKRKFKHVLDRVTELQNELFPNQSLQERQANFSEFYLEYGTGFISKLVKELQPLKGEFTIITL